jgi:uncharacterized membrane protein YkoI
VQKRTKVVVAATAVAAVALVGGGIAVASADDADAPITGEALERASEAALAYTGEGRVTDTEVGDEESYYEVEVTLDDGTQVDVQLDERFNVVAREADSDEIED